MEIAATAQPRYQWPSGGKRMRFMTDAVTIVAGAANTGGVYSLFEMETPPFGGQPPHTQRYEDESFYVLSGRYAFVLGDEEVELGPGGYMFVPRGTPHSFTNAGPTTARMLVFVTPGGIQETFLDEVSDRTGRPVGEPEMARVLAVAPKYGVEFVSSDAASEITPVAP
jgi:mannose-6-phosphate isomerase-like protein (cupin superfamily)